ncbi:hypothetical protein ACFQ09_22320 [Massilia norwichensis]|uniref:Uncharacterized protein n=1 Tax=Massilia norwichensis TaxID=1442366 RepID=A0ABT2A540_9BURK|nr:hypothetical protein [Massilia norwichensis]MCS0589288.1 hypothetical protein [Massilia norwichensis]
MSDVEGKILKMYDKSKPEDEDLADTKYYLHWLWGVVAVLVGMVFWLCIALVNAENQRYALLTNKCADPVFKGEVDRQCLRIVSSRDHWWEHLWYGVTHLRAEQPEARRR